MADGLTANYSFVLPEIGASDDTWGNKLNANWSSVDGILKTNFDTFKSDISKGMPTGSVIMRATTAVPSGWLECNGAAISRTTYALLFAVIGVMFGAGDGVNTFNLPDMRGMFPRGYDNARGLDTGRVFGVYQQDGIRRHAHSGVTASENAAHTHGQQGTFTTGGTSYTDQNVALHDGTTRTPASNSAGSALGSVGAKTTSHTHQVSISGQTGTESANHQHVFTTDYQAVNATGPDETRPWNLTMMFMIKTGL